MQDNLTKSLPVITNDGQTKTDSSQRTSSPQANQVDCTQEFIEVMQKAGVICHDSIVADGKIHRFKSDGKSKQNGWYVFFGVAGAFGDWSKGIHEIWSTKSQSLSKDEQKKFKQQIKLAQKTHQEETEEKHSLTALQAEREWSTLSQEGTSPYLDIKKVKAFGIRYGKDFVIVSLRDIDGKLWSYQKIYNDGNKRFLTGGRVAGCFHTIGIIVEDGKLIYVTEGYASGASVHTATGATVIITFNAGNLEKVIGEIKKRYPACQINIAADDDQWKEINTGREKAEEAANKHGCKVVFPIFQNVETQPTDYNDLHCLEGIDVVRSQLEQALKIKAKLALPSGFSIRKDGLYCEEGRICSLIEVLACTRDENQENWGRLVQFKDLDNYTHQIALPMELLKGDYNELFGLLLSKGLRIASNRGTRNKLVDFLQNINIEKKALCTSRIGWHGNHFIFPDGSIPETDEVFLQSDNNNFVGFRSAGKLEEWKEHIATPCQGNSRLVFSLSCAFAAPLLPLLHLESGGFNLKGTTSIGKSTALAVAASVWGNTKFIQQWKSTGNALETVAEAHNNSLLCLDELGQIDGKEAGEITYMLANGSGKNRMKSKGGLRKKYEWNLLFLSTGEISISDKMNEAGKAIQAGMMIRMVDIRADANKGYLLFDTIHEFNNGKELANHLKSSVARYYGTPIRSYISSLAQPQVKEALPEMVEQFKQTFFSKFVPDGASSEIQRVAQRFIIVAAGGELAIKFGILPYEAGKTFEAVGVCFQAWLEERGSTKSYEEEEAIKQVRAFFEAHHSSRFATMEGKDEDAKINLSDENQKVVNQAGYKRKVKIIISEGVEDESWEFFVSSEKFKNEICKGFDYRMVLQWFALRGVLKRANERQFVKSQRLPIGTKKVLHFTSAILTGEFETGESE